jgi:hypothetical protein
VYDGGLFRSSLAIFCPAPGAAAVIGSATTLILVNVFPAPDPGSLSVITIAAAGLLVLMFR